MYLLKKSEMGTESSITELEISETEEYYKFSFSAYESSLLSPYCKDNEPLFEGDVCEVFIGSSDDINNYYEIEISPFDNYFFARIFNSRKYNSCNDIIVNFQENNGFFTKKVRKTEKDYFVEIYINKKALNIERAKVVFNAFRIERKDIASRTITRDTYALNPTLSRSFHKPECFVRIKDYIR